MNNSPAVRELIDALSFHDFAQLIKLYKACEKGNDRRVQEIVIRHFENRPQVVYAIAQLMLARRFGMEMP
jgi:hypothetical protein